MTQTYTDNASTSKRVLNELTWREKSTNDGSYLVSPNDNNLT